MIYFLFETRSHLPFLLLASQQQENNLEVRVPGARTITGVTAWYLRLTTTCIPQVCH